MKISLQPDLMRLKGAQLVRDTAGTGFIKIPIDQAGLTVFDRKDGKGCTLPLIVSEKSDSYGNDFMVSRAYSKSESEYNKTAPEGQRKQTEILGNGKYLQKPEAMQSDTSEFTADPTDMPF